MPDIQGPGGTLPLLLLILGSGGVVLFFFQERKALDVFGQRSDMTCHFKIITSIYSVYFIEYKRLKSRAGNLVKK